MKKKTNTAAKIYTATERVNIRLRPTYDSPIVRTIEAGDEIDIEKTYSRLGVTWGKINDTKEFICLNFCKKKAE